MATWLLSLADAAQLAGFSIRHWRRIVEENPKRLPIQKFGRKFFLLRKDVEAWLECPSQKPDVTHTVVPRGASLQGNRSRNTTPPAEPLNESPDESKSDTAEPEDIIDAWLDNWDN